MTGKLVLVKHARPVLVPDVPPREWGLGPEGEEQATRLAGRLREFMPFIMATSPEPKAVRTAEIVGRELGVRQEIVDALCELDRPALPLMDRAERDQLNAPLFLEPSRVVIGRESANDALARFRRGVANALATAQGCQTLVIISHGTVITLLAAAHNAIDPVEFWKRLDCASFVVLVLPGYQIERVDRADR